MQKWDSKQCASQICHSKHRHHKNRTTNVNHLIILPFRIFFLFSFFLFRYLVGYNDFLALYICMGSAAADTEGGGKHRAAVAARPACMPAVAAAACRCAGAGVGSGRTPGPCLLAKRGQRLAWLPARGGGRRAASLPARQGQRRRQACPSDGGGGPGYPVNAPAGCNLCIRAKWTYHTLNT